MRRTLGLLAGLAALAAAASAAAATPSGGLQAVPVKAAFPERALVLTLPEKMALGGGGARVYENGVPVKGLSIAPAAGSAAGTFGFVLALDASNSMRGDPIRNALAAARSFAAERPPGTALGLVTFGAGVTTVLKPSTDATAIHSALARRPRLSQGTRMRDAVAQAIELLAQNRVRAGSVVVLSDGTDIGSRTSSAGLVRLARHSGTRIFTVGLRSPQFKPSALRGLATQTGGRYAEAQKSAALTPLYRALGHDLAREYLIRYRSPAAPGTRVHVAVRVGGLDGTATFVYGAPGRAGAVYHDSWQSRFWRSTSGIAATVLLAALLAAAALALLVRAARPSLRSRVAAYVRTPAPQRREERLGDRVTSMVDRSLARSQSWRRFAEQVEIAQLPLSAEAIAVVAGVAALLLGPFAAAVAQQPLLLVLTIVPPLAARMVVGNRLRRIRRRFEEELPDNLQVLGSALRAGHGLSGALGVVVRDAVEPAHSEFERALSDERLGTPLEDALSTVAQRMESDDLEQVALVATLHRETGGNTAEVLDRVHDAVRERAELRRMVRSLTAEGRMTRWILTALPVVLILAIALLNRGYLSPLLDTNGGRVLLVVAAGMVGLGSYVIKRIIEIDV